MKVFGYFCLFCIPEEGKNYMITLPLIAQITHNLFNIFSRLSLVQDGLDNVIRFKAGRTSRYFVVNLYSSPMTNEAASLSRERELWEKKVFSKKESNGSKTYAKLMNIFTTRFGYTWFFNGSKQFKIENHVRLYDHIPQLGGPIAEDQVAEKLSKSQEYL